MSNNTNLQGNNNNGVSSSPTSSSVNPPSMNSLAIQGLTEFIGTFLFIAVVLTKGKAIPIAIALAAVIYFGSNTSKACFNPAISLAQYERGDLHKSEFFVYVGVEILAALAALYWYQKTSNSNNQVK